ncbi:hypothetical protein GCM10017744_091750 [Streptomyces antimycoticus]|uniref:Luciferase-like domain-containing protein n=1 Tax=Streptomyces antimycoticus TaxID=68175 RepID=A0A4D4JRY4_9ACTN|nr:hypothetical protein SANT12839_003730 [Streptomyces antimycoticus]
MDGRPRPCPACAERPYPGVDGQMPRVYENHMDPLVALTFAASHTTRVHLGTSTLNALWQPPSCWPGR